MKHTWPVCAAMLVAVSMSSSAGEAIAADPAKVLRIASPDIATLDPQQYTDDPSYQIITAIFEGLYEYDYLASTPRLAPLTADGMPTITDEGTTWTIRLKPGIFFTPDPAFQGKRRELVAEDYVYAYKRRLDPTLLRGGSPFLTSVIVGARAVVDAARQPGGRFDYDAPIEGLRALDRNTLQLKLTEPNFPVVADTLTFGAGAREVIEAAGPEVRSHPVGTGPYRLREWRRGSRIVLEANPEYRTLRFPDSGDPARAALVASMKGKSLPQIGVVDISIIEEDTPRLLEFDRGGLDYIALRGSVAAQLLENGKLKPQYAGRGVKRYAFPEPFLFSIGFNMESPVVGGIDSARIALRRAIAMAVDMHAFVDVVYAGQAVAANQLVPPGVSGHDAALPWKPLYDPAGAKALLDRFGYGNLDAKGYRKAPDGTPLLLGFTLRSGAVSREVQTLIKRDLDAVGLRVDFHVTPFQDAIKEIVAGKFQMYFGGFGGSPSGYAEMIQLWSRSEPAVNHTRFRNDAYDAAFIDFLRKSDDAGQIAAARRMNDIVRAYVPLLPAIFRLESDFVQPWVSGFSPPVFQTYWKYLDIDVAARRKVAGR